MPISYELYSTNKNYTKNSTLNILSQLINNKKNENAKKKIFEKRNLNKYDNIMKEKYENSDYNNKKNVEKRNLNKHENMMKEKYSNSDFNDFC